MIWGISAALHEATEMDRRAARYTNKDLAEYLMPVHADVGQIDVILVPEEDRLVNPLGIKGIGELGNDIRPKCLKVKLFFGAIFCGILRPCRAQDNPD